MKKTLLFVIVAAVASAPLSAQSEPLDQWRALDSALAIRVAGCYELVADGWQSDSELAKIQTIPTEPVRFELTNKVASGWAALSDMAHSVYFEVHSDSIAPWGRGLFTSWVRLPNDQPTILVSRPLPMAGLRLRLTQRGSDLVGEITAFTDAIRPNRKSEASHAVTARRINCART